MRKPVPTIEELAAEVHEAAENVRRANQEEVRLREELRRRLCVAAGRGNYESGRRLLADLLGLQAKN